MQKRLLLFILAVSATFPTAASPDTPQSLLKTADSLFQARQYVQSRDRYAQIIDQKLYSPAMLLRLAFIEEGLGHLSRSLYYLNLYYLATDDKDALAKLEEVAKKNALQGYATSDSGHVFHLLQTWRYYLMACLAACCLLTLAFLVYHRRQPGRPYFAGIALVCLAIGLFAIVNLPAFDEQIITDNRQTYLMKGPAASADVLTTVGEGHRLTVTGSSDVWLKVSWRDADAWVKRGDVLVVGL